MFLGLSGALQGCFLSQSPPFTPTGQVKWEQSLPQWDIGQGTTKPSELLGGVFRDKGEAEQEFQMELEQSELFWDHGETL